MILSRDMSANMEVSENLENVYLYRKYKLYGKI